MSLKIYNVLTKKKEDFVPIEEGKVKMYACGITASGKAHIGHAYQALIFDTIRNYLEFKGYDVTYVRNYTDVDDKIIIKAREQKVNPKDFADKMMEDIDYDMERLHIEKPTIQSKATECISDIIKFIEELIEKGSAYPTESGDVYFKVSSFDEYGKLSNRKLDDELTGVRKEIEPGKLDEKDFALWKNAKDDEIFWNSPWGKGRPGWHIECSAMSMKYLGKTIDIHGGGKDLIFPHHENEIAQSESLTGKQFSNYWIHNGLIKINGQKMSKSLGNSILLSDLLDQYNYEVIKLTLLQNSYRTDMNVMDNHFEDYEKLLYKLYAVFNIIDNYEVEVNYKESEEYKEIRNKFEEAMDNDFNTSLAISYLYDYLNVINKLLKDKEYVGASNIKSSLQELYKVLGLLTIEPKEFIKEIKEKYIKINNITEEEIIDLMEQRTLYKQNKEYEKADEIRKQLLDKNIVLNDTREGTSWDINI